MKTRGRTDGRTLQGYDDGDELGAAPRIVKESNGRYIYYKGEPTQARRQYIPMPEVTVPAGGSAVQTVSPQAIFQVQKINIEEQTPGELLVSDISVGKKPQFIATGKIDASNFKPDAVSSYIDFDAGDVGHTFTITYENTTAAAIIVRPMVIALVAE